jgi:hypothetical protein
MHDIHHTININVVQPLLIRDLVFSDKNAGFYPVLSWLIELKPL